MEKMFRNVVVSKDDKEYFGELFVDFEPLYEDTRFSAYNLMGSFEDFGSPSIAIDVRINSATLFPVKGEEIEFEGYEAEEEFAYLKDRLIDIANKENY